MITASLFAEGERRNNDTLPEVCDQTSREEYESHLKDDHPTGCHNKEGPSEGEEENNSKVETVKKILPGM